METMPDEGREERGKAMADAKKIRRKGPLWMVPSASNAGTYVVDIAAEEGPTCSCPDYELRQCKCKHIHAVEFTIIRETAPDGTVTETRSVKVTYKQDWPAYNAAQVNEQERVETLLRGLCDGIQQPPQGKGRPRAPLSDMVFSAVMKIYGTMSGRRSQSDLRNCEARGQIKAAPHYNTVFKYLEDASLTQILKALIEESASPLKGIETDFAIDGTGFSTCNYVRWYDAKYGREMKAHTWLKAHLMCGVKTNVVTSCEVTEGNMHDSPEFAGLLAATKAQGFDIQEVSADKGYVSKFNSAAVILAGATPYIPFKSNNTGSGPEFWRKLYHYYHYNRVEFLSHYHKRSNIESTNWMIKSKFGAALRSKGFVAQTNELLCKVVCHNLAVLVSSIYELGIEPTFWADKAVAQKRAAH
jgi:transposase